MNALLLLADGRFPAGGHAHSGGVEAAVVDGRITGVASLAAFTQGRLRTVGLVEAAMAMATATRLARPLDAEALRGLLDGLDAEVDARTPAAPLRAASRRLGRQLLRVGARCWPSPLLVLAMEPGREIHQAVAFGLVGAAADLTVDEIGHLVVHHAITTPMQAGVRLLGLDPYAVAAATAALGLVAASVVADARFYSDGPLQDLPARSATLIDLAAMAHAGTDGRLFAT